MGMNFKKNLAQLTDMISVEDAETLLEWCQKHSNGKIDLSDCTHLHAANLQVLMASRLNIVTWPKDDNLKTWLQAALVA